MRCEFNIWVRKIPRRRAWQLTPLFAWRIPWTEEAGGLQSIGCRRVRHDWSNLARTHPANTFMLWGEEKSWWGSGHSFSWSLLCYYRTSVNFHAEEKVHREVHPQHICLRWAFLLRGRQEDSEPRSQSWWAALAMYYPCPVLRHFKSPWTIHSEVKTMRLRLAKHGSAPMPVPDGEASVGTVLMLRLFILSGELPPEKESKMIIGRWQVKWEVARSIANVSSPREGGAVAFLIFFKKLFIYLILGCTGSSLLCVGFLYWRRGGATLSCRAWASRCAGFCCGARALERMGTDICGAQALLLWGMWILLRLGIEPASPSLAGGFLTTEPPGKSQPS